MRSILNSFQRLPLWVRLWMVLWLMPINVATLFFMDWQHGQAVAILANVGMLLNVPIILYDKGVNETNFVGADLSEAALHGAELLIAELREANLNKAALVGADLRSARLQNAHLDEADLEAAKLAGANLESADLGLANLVQADLYNARLERADLSLANLTEANLGYARFDNGTRLVSSIMDRAQVKSVDFSHVPWILNHRKQMFGDESVILPGDAAHPEHWPKHVLSREQFDLEYEIWKADPEAYTPPEPPETFSL
ncbi:MAG: pentapeptide repeat-containing protein [Pelagimonas sp.]|nr:pentapeptide repeat-containing protein [Pelagimonas sp.]